MRNGRLVVSERAQRVWRLLTQHYDLIGRLTGRDGRLLLYQHIGRAIEGADRYQPPRAWARLARDLRAAGRAAP